jgi:hypothetical protein
MQPNTMGGKSLAGQSDRFWRYDQAAFAKYRRPFTGKSFTGNDKASPGKSRIGGHDMPIIKHLTSKTGTGSKRMINFIGA